MNDCPTCGGVGGLDSGGVTPWGTGIDVPCPSCSEPKKTSFLAPYVRTFSGRAFPVSPEPEDVSILDIAHGLSMVPRWGGHTPVRYPVAAHSIYVSLLVRPELRLEALLHDASEAYLCDIPSPFKAALPDYHIVEGRIMRAVGSRFGFGWPVSPEVKKADAVALSRERDAFFCAEFYDDVQETRGDIFPDWNFFRWDSLQVYQITELFLDRYKQLCKTP